MKLFTGRIESWADWGRVFRSVPAFPHWLNIYLIRKTCLPGKSKTSPTNNAVFKAGGFVVKIFAPAEWNRPDGRPAAKLCAERANETGVSSQG